MINDLAIVSIERLRDDLSEVRQELKLKYKNSSQQVTSVNLRKKLAKISETWMVDFASRKEIGPVIGSDYFANITVHFQRLLTCSEHACLRSKYDFDIKAILDDFTVKVIVPLKQILTTKDDNLSTISKIGSPPMATNSPLTAFVGQSFLSSDFIVNECVKQGLETIGIKVITGEKPKADTISAKIKNSIDDADFFVGIFTKRDKIARKNEWTTSLWVIDEKAYAVGKGKKLILFKENGVNTIGGIQGDYEYLEFSRDRLQEMLVKLLKLFEFKLIGFSQ